MNTSAIAPVRQRKGFSLTEVMVALMVLALVMAGAYQVLMVAGNLRYSARNHYIAVVMANNRIERAKNFKYEDLHLLRESNVIVDDDGAPAVGGLFRRSTTINTAYAERLTEVRCVVEIRDRKTSTFRGASESVTTLLTAYVVPEEETEP